jgi:hypothetical protein
MPKTAPGLHQRLSLNRHANLAHPSKNAILIKKFTNHPEGKSEALLTGRAREMVKYPSHTHQWSSDHLGMNPFYTGRLPSVPPAFATGQAVPPGLCVNPR